MKHISNRNLPTILKEKYSNDLNNLGHKVFKLYGNDAYIGFLLLQPNYVNPEWIRVTATEIAVVKNIRDENHNLAIPEILEKATVICNKKLHRNFQTIQIQDHGYAKSLFSLLSLFDSNDFDKSEIKLLEDYFLDFADIRTTW